MRDHLARIVLQLLADFVGLMLLAMRPRRSVEAENLVLRRQLALFKERGVKPRRIDARNSSEHGLAVDVVRLALLSNRRSSRNRDPVAPSGMATAVALQVATGTPCGPQ